MPVCVGLWCTGFGAFAKLQHEEIMHAVIQILKVNDIKAGTSSKTGRPYELQDCECILLDETGQPSQIGVLSLPKDLRGKVSPGTYTGSFTLKPDLSTRRIEAHLVGLNPVPVRSAAARPAGASGG